MAGLLIEILIVVLLILTVSYCIALNRRLKLFRADEAAMRVTIGELITAVEMAERAIKGLRHTASECQAGLQKKLKDADTFSEELEARITAGKYVLNRLAQVSEASRQAKKIAPPEKAAEKDPRAVLKAAEEASNRLAVYRRSKGVAA